MASPATLHSQPADVIAPGRQADANVLQDVFLYAAPVGLLAFVLALFLPEVPLRDAARAGAGDLGQGSGMAESTDSARDGGPPGPADAARGPSRLPAIRIASGTALGGAETWCVAQVLLREPHDVPADLDTIASAHERSGASVLLPAFALTEDGGYLTGGRGSGWHTTEVARVQWEVFSAELRSWLLNRMGSTTDTADAAAELLEATLRRMVDQILGEEGGFRADSRGPRTGQ